LLFLLATLKSPFKVLVPEQKPQKSHEIMLAAKKKYSKSAYP